MPNFTLCPECGSTYDSDYDPDCSLHKQCRGDWQGNCDHCDMHGTEMRMMPFGGMEHRDPRECIYRLRQTLRYVEQGQLLHDNRYCELEDSIKEFMARTQEVLVGRRAAIDESRVRKALREGDES